MRNARENPPTIDVVAPDGSVHACRIAKGITHPWLDRLGRIRPGHREAGYVPMLELYEREGPAGGPGVWADYQAAVASGRRAVLDDAWLPPTVRTRRAAAASTAAPWTSPEPPRAA